MNECKKICFLDIETTGFSREWDDILQVAGIIYDPEAKIVLNSFEKFIKPKKPINKMIEQLTGITNKKVADCDNEFIVLNEFVEWIYLNQPDLLVGHNIDAFDMSFINTKLKRYRLEPVDKKTFDTLKFARKLGKAGKLPTPNFKQETLAQHYGIEYGAHNAMEDIKALIKIYERMMVEVNEK